MKKRLTFSFFILLMLSIVLSACASKSAPDSYEAREAPMYAAPMESYDMVAEEQYAIEEGREFVSGTGELAKMIQRMVVYNAEMRISVEDPEVTMQAIIDMAVDLGGFVVSSNLYKTNTDRGNLPKAYITVRVPAGSLDPIMTSIRALTLNPKDDVLSENVSGQDVTAEYTDLESRLRNLEAAEQALVTLMEDAQDPQDVLDVFSELTYYRGEIEIVKGRMRYLEESAALSALSVEVVSKRSLQPIEIAGWEPKGTVKEAVEALIDAGQFLVDALIWFGIFCLPFLIPLGIVIYFLVRYFRKRKALKKAGKAEIETLSQPGKAPEPGE